MIKVVTVEEMRAIEAAADRAGVSYARMMEVAGKAVADRAWELIRNRELAAPRIVVLVGPGNNGGDGLVAAKLLAGRGAVVGVYLARPREDALVSEAKAAGVALLEGDYEALRALIAGADMIIDALLGTGAKLPIRGEIKAVLQQVCIALEARAALTAAANEKWITPTEVAPQSMPDRPLIIAVDVPSGLDSDSGALDELALKADETITFEAAKPGHVLFPGAEAVGVLHVAPLHLPESLPERDSIRRVMADARLVRSLLPKRPLNSNKGTYGKALVFGGSDSYIGAPGLAAMGAYRAGAGLVTVAAPAHIIPILASQIAEATWLPLPIPVEPAEDKNEAITNAAASIAYTQMPNYNAMLLGPGLGRALNVYALVETLFSYGNGQMPPLVIDADGLNMLATMESWWSHLPRRTILTPHPGEMARLAKTNQSGWRTSTQIVQADRIGIATQKAAEWGCVVVLKGAYTLVADSDGRLAVIPFAEPALARAGTGDVLAGVIVGLLAQGLDPFDAATAGAYIHAYAGRLAAQHLGTRSSVLATDVVATLPTVFAEFEARSNH